MNETVRFIDQSGARPGAMDLWPAIVIPKETIDAEVERLAGLPRPANGRRRSIIAHPRAQSGHGLAAGIQVALDVLLPGERTVPYRQNSTQVNFVIRGRGHSIVGGKRFEVNLYDVWITPSMHIYWHGNDSKDIQVRLTYSNAALLELMNIHYVEENPPPIEPVKHHLDKLQALGKDYIGRRLYMLYNPMTGRTNGCTPSFFATMTIRPPKIVDRPHRHTSAAINYYFHGTGRSTVGGEVLEWKAGDLMLSAPGWAVHNHASHDDYVYELTVQDQPLNIAMESLLWQESLKLPMAVLAVEEGLGANRAAK